MKILFISNGHEVDYLNDLLFYGLYDLGEEVVDVNKIEHLYQDYTKDEKLLYGKSFSVSRLIPADNTDRSDIETKIKNNYFDVVIFGSVWRSLNYLELVIKHYPVKKIIFVDGEDSTSLHPRGTYFPYFKRELINFDRAYPISFSFPRIKLAVNTIKKTKPWGTIIPGDISTYIFNDEATYYSDYEDSYFGHTCRKAGWDCLRHYEIIGNNCFPWFYGLEECPKFTMTTFPKDIVLTKRKEWEGRFVSLDEFSFTMKLLRAHVESYMTSDKVAEYVINLIKCL